MNFGRFDSNTDRGSNVGQAEMVGLNGADFWQGGNRIEKIAGTTDGRLNITAGGGNSNLPIESRLENFQYEKQKQLSKLIKDDKAFDAANAALLPEIRQLVKDSDAAFVSVWKQNKSAYETLRPGLDAFRNDVAKTADAALKKLKDIPMSDDERKRLTDVLQPGYILSFTADPYSNTVRNALSAHKELAGTNQHLTRLFDDSFMQRSSYDRIWRNLVTASKTMADTRTEAISITEVAKLESESDRYARERKNIQLTVASNHIQELLDADHPFYYDFDKPGNPRVPLESGV